MGPHNPDMSTRTDHLMKALRTLPYGDMIKVAQALSEELKGIHSAHHLADALVNVQAKFVDGDKLDEQEDSALREMVGTRSRGFDVKVRRVGAQQGGHWTAHCDQFRAPHAVGKTAREAITLYLDQAVTAHLMMK